MRFVLLLLLFTAILTVRAQDIVYERIPKYNVGYFVQDFFEQRGIYDCFKRQIDNNLLYLKCMKERKIIDIIISIHGDNTKYSVNI